MLMQFAFRCWQCLLNLKIVSFTAEKQTACQKEAVLQSNGYRKRNFVLDVPTVKNFTSRTSSAISSVHVCVQETAGHRLLVEKEIEFVLHCT